MIAARGFGACEAEVVNVVFRSMQWAHTLASWPMMGGVAQMAYLRTSHESVLGETPRRAVHVVRGGVQRRWIALIVG